MQPGFRRLLIFSHFPKAAAIPFDIRNGPNRLRESPWEWRYQRMKDAGYRDTICLAPQEPLPSDNNASCPSPRRPGVGAEESPTQPQGRANT